MSIITDALKKAEREREIKLKFQAEKKSETTVPAQAQALEILIDQDQAVEEDLSRLQTAPEFSQKRTQTNFWYLWPLGAVLFICLTALVLLPNWPLMRKDFSMEWTSPSPDPNFVRAVSDVPQYGVISEASSYALQSMGQLAYRLSGISSSGNERYAIINGSVVQKGAALNGAVVKEILGREVILQTKSGDLRLTLES